MTDTPDVGESPATPASTLSVYDDMCIRTVKDLVTYYIIYVIMRLSCFETVYLQCNEQCAC